MTKFEELMDDKKFTDSLEGASFDEVKAAFKNEGVDLDVLLKTDDDKADELTENDLDEVSGGITGGDLFRIVKQSYKVVKEGKFGIFKYGMSAGVLLRAYYDSIVYNDVTRSYSADEIMRAARYMGVE